MKAPKKQKFSSDDPKVSLMYKQGYRFVGPHKHSAIKVCEWCRESLRGNRVCYKEQFYSKEDNVHSHRCVQFTPVVFWCSHNCEFCWRVSAFSMPKGIKWDKPKQLVDEAIVAHQQILQGFKGAEKVDLDKFKEAMTPKQFAISLTGEPTLYPYLPQLVKEIKSRGISAYVVSNGTNPDMIKKLVKNPPTKMYITLPAPNEETYLKVCNPSIDNGWQKILQSLSLLKKFPSSVVRLTLVKELNMNNPEEYAKIIYDNHPDYVEIKAFMSIGNARDRLPITRMPTHLQIKYFANEIIKAMPYANKYKILDEKIDSRVVVLKWIQ